MLYKSIENNRMNTTNSIFNRVFKFNEDAGTPMLQNSLESAQAINEIAMLQEELNELVAAFKNDNNRTEIADALGDIIYVAMGTMGKLGIDYERVMDEICTSNETKYTNGVLVKNDAGKIQKGPDFKHPDLSFVSTPMEHPLKGLQKGVTIISSRSEGEAPRYSTKIIQGGSE